MENARRRTEKKDISIFRKETNRLTSQIKIKITYFGSLKDFGDLEKKL